MDKFEYIKDRWGWEPHPGQREFMGFPSKTKIAACGRRWGKTEAVAYDMAYAFLTNENYSQMIVSPTYEQSRLIFSTVEYLLGNMKDIEIKKTPYPFIKLGNRLITARTGDSDGRGLRGFKAHRIAVDEAAFVKGNVIYEVISPMLADCDGELILISTPFGKNHFYDFYRKGIEKNGEFASFSYKSADNPYISREYIERQRENLSELSFQTEYEAKFCDNVSSVFRYESIRNAINNHNHPEGCVVFGVDFARYSDYTAIAVLKTDGSCSRLTDLVRFNRLTWREEIRRIGDLAKRYRPVRIVCDATGVGDPLCEDLEEFIISEGLDTELVKFRFMNESKNLIMDYLNILLERGKISLPNNEILIEELDNFEYSCTDAGNIQLEARYSHHDDTVCALALACHGAKGLGGGKIYVC